MTELHGQLRKLDALTGLRFFACAMILLHHMRGSFGLPVFKGWLLDQGVSLFFILSGFVLAYSYPALTTWADRRRFLIARFARLWPAYLVSILLVAVVNPRIFAIDDLAWRGISNALLIQAWIPVTSMMGSFNGPSWSISTEVGFYILFLWLILNFDTTWWWKWILSLAIAASSISLVNSFGGGTWLAPLQSNPLPRALEFVSGMVTCVLWRKRSNTIGSTNSYRATVAEVIFVLAFARTASRTETVTRRVPRHPS